MLHVTKIGPIRIAGQQLWLFFGGIDGRLEPVDAGTSERRALEILAARAPGHTLRCDKELLESGRPLGYEAGALPDDLKPAIAGLSLSLALGPHRIPPSVLMDFLDASLAYASAGVWEHWDDEAVILVTVENQAGTREYEASILGSAGVTTGFVIHSAKNAARRLGLLSDGGWEKEGLKLPAIAMTLSEEPAWVAAIMQRAVGLPFVPLPIATGAGEAAVPTESQLLDLTAALHAAADLTPTVRQVEKELFLDEHRVLVRVSAPRPG